ncbi:N-acetylmuramoyl-L-alanine amidase [Lawsonibacter sp. OA9]|uniref:N-acetylmuramoyl-L-alanine amidase n=1 Tax=Oscillospiraceae TaxID=216572 RepID=UPI001F05DE6A|nr:MULTISPECIES: N-acetylmuramoyl-L-alanine amidase [Oscillospiraceae]MCH1978231.1 N-acetylmuramoyl-L-alanine amidase [Lawsonibacter sp. OA9]MCH1981893.1 N-acetylmuramoyl-L-alanine amidase [Ruminococcus sp. OA3]
MDRKKWKPVVDIMLGCLLLVGVYYLSREGARLVTQELQGRQTVVIDAGHGGDDPGKVGINNELEKDLNLEIAKKVEKLLQESGYQVIMTRTKDEMLCGRGSQNKKAEDLKKRCQIINESSADCAVSIHQNSYSDEAVKGAQVFYFEHSEDGKQLASMLQNALVDGLDPQNHRKEKGNITYYLLKKTEVPIVIVECGFLSNSEEAGKLKTEAYQDKVAAAVTAGVREYLGDS